MFSVITAPAPLTDYAVRIFLAGGITGCPDWQASAVERLRDLYASWPFVHDEDLQILNPRRPVWPEDFPQDGEARKQIAWEASALDSADVILFWFPGGHQVQPIALFELGRWSYTQKPVLVGAAPQYTRRFDIVEQMRLSNKSVYQNLEDCCSAAYLAAGLRAARLTNSP